MKTCFPGQETDFLGKKVVDLESELTFCVSRVMLKEPNGFFNLSVRNSPKLPRDATEGPRSKGHFWFVSTTS